MDAADGVRAHHAPEDRGGFAVRGGGGSRGRDRGGRPSQRSGIRGRRRFVPVPKVSLAASEHRLALSGLACRPGELFGVRGGAIVVLLLRAALVPVSAERGESEGRGADSPLIGLGVLAACCPEERPGCWLGKWKASQDA